MYPSLNLGSVALPTGPLSALLAVWLAIELAARRGQRYGLPYDELLGMFMAALAAGIAAARLWHVLSYWSAYRDHLADILALRPTGLAPVPGYVAAFLAAYAYMIARRMDPVAAGAAALAGLAGGGAVYFFGSYLSGRVIGTVSALPWALPYGDATRHPVGIYLALGCVPIWMQAWYGKAEPRKALLRGLFLFALLFLFAEAFTLYRWYNPPIRWPQLGYLLTAVAAATALARTAPPAQPAPASDPASGTTTRPP